MSAEHNCKDDHTFLVHPTVVAAHCERVRQACLLFGSPIARKGPTVLLGPCTNKHHASELPAKFWFCGAS